MTATGNRVRSMVHPNYILRLCAYVARNTVDEEEDVALDLVVNARRQLDLMIRILRGSEWALERPDDWRVCSCPICEADGTIDQKTYDRSGEHADDCPFRQLFELTAYPELEQITKLAAHIRKYDREHANDGPDKKNQWRETRGRLLEQILAAALGEP